MGQNCCWGAGLRLAGPFCVFQNGGNNVSDSLEQDNLKLLCRNIAQGMDEQLIHGISGAQKSYIAAQVLQQTPVSYTHLDVYKRQGHTRSRWSV